MLCETRREIFETWQTRSQVCQAQGLMPQLALAGLGGATRVGTSQLAGGTAKREQDAALDGIAFPTERWSLHGLPGMPPPGSAVANDLCPPRAAARRDCSPSATTPG